MTSQTDSFIATTDNFFSSSNGFFKVDNQTTQIMKNNTRNPREMKRKKSRQIRINSPQDNFNMNMTTYKMNETIAQGGQNRFSPVKFTQTFFDLNDKMMKKNQSCFFNINNKNETDFSIISNDNNQEIFDGEKTEKGENSLNKNNKDLNTTIQNTQASNNPSNKNKNSLSNKNIRVVTFNDKDKSIFNSQNQTIIDEGNIQTEETREDDYKKIDITKIIDFNTKGALERIMFIQRAWKRRFLVKNFAAEFLQSHIRAFFTRSKFRAYCGKLTKMNQGLNLVSKILCPKLFSMFFLQLRPFKSVRFITNFVVKIQKFYKGKKLRERLLKEKLKPKVVGNSFVINKEIRKNKHAIKEKIKDKVKLIQKEYMKFIINKIRKERAKEKELPKEKENKILCTRPDFNNYNSISNESPNLNNNLEKATLDSKNNKTELSNNFQCFTTTNSQSNQEKNSNYSLILLFL